MRLPWLKIHGKRMSPFSINMSCVFYKTYTKLKQVNSTNTLSNASVLEENNLTYLHQHVQFTIYP